MYVALLLPVIGLLALPALWFLSPPLFRVLTNEDGLIEWVQFFAFFASAVVAGIIAWDRWRAGHRWQGALYAVVCIGLVAVAGEEISWGQRLIGFEAPDAIREINDQDEMTFHNITGVLLLFNVGLLLASLYAMVADPIGRRLGLWARWRDADLLFAPPQFLAAAFGVMAVFRALRMTVVGGGYGITRIGEWAELCFALAILTFLTLAIMRTRERRAHEAAAKVEPNRERHTPPTRAASS